MMRLALIRHGPTEWNEAGRLQGLTDVPLSPTGLETVKKWRVPEDYRDFAWVASPLRRAQETARLLGLACAIEPSICEMNWGEWEGRTRDELIRDYGDEFHNRAAKGLDLRPHGGETPRDVRDRLRAWIATHADGTPRNIGAVTHQGIIRAALSLATGWEMTGKPPVRMDWAALHVFAVDANGRVAIEAMNVSLETA
jgi:probable phosphoglycerate mutase